MRNKRNAGRGRLLAPMLLALGAAGPSTPSLLREQAWTVEDARLAYSLTTAPPECLAARTPAIETGRALFRSPAILGGPAARLGLSCNACHANGRINAQFLLPELTDRPGAADVTSEWTSRVRGDGVFNPRDIPDLVDVARRKTFGAARDPSLENFVRGVIAEEFQGEPPSDAVLDALIAYLQAMDSRTCAGAATAVTLASAAGDVRRALSAAEQNDAATASLLLLTAQDGVGRIVERLPARVFADETEDLEALARELGQWRLGADVAAAMQVALPGWRARFDAVVLRVAGRERLSYFNEATLRAALGRQRGPGRAR